MSFWDLILLTLVCYAVVYSVIDRICKCIEHCKTAKSVADTMNSVSKSHNFHEKNDVSKEISEEMVEE